MPEESDRGWSPFTVDCDDSWKTQIERSRVYSDDKQRQNLLSFLPG